MNQPVAVVEEPDVVLAGETAGIRILIVDDNPAIHRDLSRVLNPTPPGNAELDELARIFLQEDAPAEVAVERPQFRIDDAYQGAEALAMVQAALAASDPYQMVFMDVRMPPGWDGVETLERIWAIDPTLQAVLCTAFSDHSWDDIARRLRSSDCLLVIKKPFDAIEVKQAACALTRKWQLARELSNHVEQLESLVADRTVDLKQALERLVDEHQRREAAQTELRMARQLEALGQLAAGVAHEINTPAQYVSDSVHFLKEAFEAIQPVLEGGVPDPNAADDLEFLAAEVPPALERASSGLMRITELVRALKELGHPDSDGPVEADVCSIVRNAAAVCKGEYRYVASVELDLPESAVISCYIGGLGQVLLNLIVNAAHAVGDAHHEPDTGRIRLVVREEEAQLVIEVEDNGCGIPPDVQERMLNPLFTTKEVGRGTGQGLAIAYTIVSGRHKGRLTWTSEVGTGTTFRITLPRGKTP
ncbi:MAG: two-component system NtrC family sensor kinase [Myxococcota bacterium]|jgi:two-component system NtrC family sensor kinase